LNCFKTRDNRSIVPKRRETSIRGNEIKYKFKNRYRSIKKTRNIIVQEILIILGASWTYEILSHKQALKIANLRAGKKQEINARKDY
jgi:hypothetical protein